jgi:iron transport multicopper oxidase
MLGDWFHNISNVVFENTVNAPVPQYPMPDSATINGKGQSAGGPAVPYHVLNVERGKRYRLRLINTSAAAGFNFTIEGHKLLVIAADGINHNPVMVDYLTFWPGQRYDVIVRPLDIRD